MCNPLFIGMLKFILIWRHFGRFDLENVREDEQDWENVEGWGRRRKRAYYIPLQQNAVPESTRSRKREVATEKVKLNDTGARRNFRMRKETRHVARRNLTKALRNKTSRLESVRMMTREVHRAIVVQYAYPIPVMP